MLDPETGSWHPPPPTFPPKDMESPWSLEDDLWEVTRQGETY